jgi:predicted nucleic acid-binding protein
MRRVGELMLRYHDVPMSFADACLVSMAEVEDSAVFTLDRDFSVYRRGKNGPLRLIMP